MTRTNNVPMCIFNKAFIFALQSYVNKPVVNKESISQLQE